MIFATVSTLLVLYVTWSLVCLERNYRLASRMGVDITIIRLPIDPLNLLWQIFEPVVFSFLDLIPMSLGTFAVYSRRGWHFKDKADSHLRYGPLFAIVTPRNVWLQVADPAAVTEIFKRRTDFLRPSEFYKLLEVYGPCISTASWKDWPRHRKVLATPFNESIMSFVWTEAVSQTEQMLQSWAANEGGEIGSYAQDTRQLSLNVLAATGFHRSYKFSAKSTSTGAEGYRDSLQTVLDNVIMLMLIPPRLMRWPVFPDSWQEVGHAAAAFEKYMEQMVQQEKQLFNQDKPGSGGLMTGFMHALRANDFAATTANAATRPQTLSEKEIYGNIFVINFAGHDTTANTLAFSMLLLAANQEVQEWISEEITFVVQEKAETNDWEYGDLYLRLKRCRAVMFETLRLYPPITAIPKRSNDKPQQLRVGERTVAIPPNTVIQPSLLAIHTHPANFEDPLSWKPSRWIEIMRPAPLSNHKSRRAAEIPRPETEPGTHTEVLMTPPAGTYFPWSDGPQNCLGMKFSQVEYVAVLATIFHRRRLSIVLGSDETAEQGRRRALATAEDCDMQMLLRMRDAERVKLRCTKLLG